MSIWPQVTMIVLLAIGFTFSVAKHGESSGLYSIWNTTISTGATIALLYYGGFFKVLGW